MSHFEDELNAHGYLCYTSKGVSMYPLIRQNKDVVVIRAKQNPLKKNDAVLFRRDNGQYILHRITKVHTDGTYTIVGDNCVSGEIVREDQILGVLTEVKRGGRRIVLSDLSYRLYVRLVPVRRFFLPVTRFFRRGLSRFYHNIREK